MLPAVYYDRDHIDMVDNNLQYGQRVLKEVAKIMRKGTLSEEEVQCVLELRNEMAIYLARWEQGKGLLPSQKAEIADIEAQAAAALGDKAWEEQAA